MDRPKWPIKWEYYEKHRKVTTRLWDNGEALAISRQDESEAQYNPHLFQSDAEVSAIEIKCVAEGIPIKQRPNKWTFYLKLDCIVGVCCGEETEYVYAEWRQDGGIHGRPISEKALREKKVRL
jgi:hypothetical protein